MWHDPFTCDVIRLHVAWLIHMWHDSLICVTWLYVMLCWCPDTRGGVWHDSFICDMTRSYVIWLIYMWHDSFIWYYADAQALEEVCDMTHVCVTYSMENMCSTRESARWSRGSHAVQNEAHCNTLQHTATHCNTLKRSATQCDAVRRTATYCNTLQHTATHCNTLQHNIHTAIH